MGKRGLTRLSSTNSLSGIIPAGNIANSTLNNITAVPSAIVTGKPELISTATASSSSSIEFTSGIDSTYDIYQFEFINIHPSTDGAEWQFNLSTAKGATYNVTKTSTFFSAYHDEGNTATNLGYESGRDLAQSTSDQQLAENVGSGNDECVSGYMSIFNPSSTTFVKHFIGTTNVYMNSNYSINGFIAGYGNTTSSINAIKFQMSSGNIDAGTIKMYGISAWV